MVLSDDMDSKDLFAMAENDLDYMRVEREKATEVHWSLALQWAQESLICRDIFNQVNMISFLGRLPRYGTYIVRASCNIRE